MSSHVPTKEPTEKPTENLSYHVSTETVYSLGKSKSSSTYYYLLKATRTFANIHFLISIYTTFYTIPIPTNNYLNLLRNFLLVLPTVWCLGVSINFARWVSDRKLHLLLFDMDKRNATKEELEERKTHAEDTICYVLQGNRACTVLAFSIGKVFFKLGFVGLRAAWEPIGWVKVMGDPVEIIWWIRLAGVLWAWGVVLTLIGVFVGFGCFVAWDLLRLGVEAEEEARKNLTRD